MDTFYKIINICKDKSETVGDCSLALGIEELKVEDIDILTLNLKSIVLGCLKEIIVYIK